MENINKDLYQHFFSNFDEVVHRIVSRTSQVLQHPLSPSAFDVHQELLHHLFRKIKDEWDDHHSMAGINLDYDPTNVLSEQGYELNEIVMFLSHFRLNAFKEIEGTFQAHGGGSVRDAFHFMHRMTDMFDQAIYHSTADYQSQYQLKLNKLEDELLQLSAPVVPVKEGVAVLPIVGALSEERADPCDPESRGNQHGYPDH